MTQQTTIESPQVYITMASERRNFSEQEAGGAMEGIMEGQWTPAQIAAFITAMAMKGETRDELVGITRVMRTKAYTQSVRNRPLVDVVGSGGDGLHTVNASTLAGLIAAAAGVRIAKHGNRAMSGMCGSADMLEALGVDLELSPSQAMAGIDENGFAFLFAPLFHPSMRHAIAPRREIGIPTIFNLLGPLTNPATPEMQLIGVNREKNLQRFSEVLMDLGCTHSLAVHGEDGMDEISNTGVTRVVEQKQGQLSTYVLHPRDFNMGTVSLQALRLPDKETALKTGQALLKGNLPGPHEDLVLLNAGALLYLGAKASTIGEGVKLAGEILRSGAAEQVARRVAAYTQDKKAAEA